MRGLELSLGGPSRIGVFASLVTLTMAAACDRQPVSPEVVREVGRSSSYRLVAPAVLNARRGLYLEYGKPAPQGAVLDRLPEPFDVAKHAGARSSFVPGLTPPRNVQFPGRGIGAQRVGAAYVPPASGTDAYAGIFLDSTSRGIQGLLDLRTDVNIPSGWVKALVYAPTLLPGGGSCFEATTIHWNRQDWSDSLNFNHGLGTWNWCGPNKTWHKFAPFDNWFKQRYAATYYDEWGQPREKYYLVVAADHADRLPGSSDTWRVYLYNFSVGIYQQFDVLTGVGQYKEGWTMHESMRMQGYYNGGACMTLPSIRTISQTVLRPNGTWMPPIAAARTYAGPLAGNCWVTTSQYTIYIDPATDGDWWGWTPSNSY